MKWEKIQIPTTKQKQKQTTNNKQQTTNNKQQKISTATNNKTKTFIANTFTKNPTNTHKYPMLKLKMQTERDILVIPN